MIKRLIISLLIIFNFGNLAFATSQKNHNVNRAFDKKQPLNITSEKVEIIRDKNQIIFTNKVKALQDKFTLFADKMIVKYKEGTNKKIEIISIKTENNVKFINDKITATGNEGFYNVLQNIITLKNNVTATESGITVTAEEFEYNITTGKTNIIGNKKQNERVTIILNDVENISK